MNEIALLSLLVLVVVTLVLQLVLLARPKPIAPDLSEVNARLESMAQALQQGDRNTRDDFSRLRQEFTGQHQAFKLEIVQQIGVSRSAVAEQIQQFRLATEQRLDTFNVDTNQKIEILRKGVAESGSQLQTQVGQELERLRSGLTQTSQLSREEITTGLKGVSESLAGGHSKLAAAQKVQSEEIRSAVETRLKEMREDNERRLEQMRQTVDEKLQGTLDARLGESFKQVSDRLELVHTGLGEMQKLASGVGDLKRVLTNVKTRGTWGEVQLGNLLEQMLAADQFEKNVATTGTQERVEFAIKLPGHQEGEPCWLPIDAKFPIEDYNRIAEASESGDANTVEEACRALERTLRLCAKNISERYLLPPKTTDFAILFLSTEGLYAEALRRAGLAEALQREYRVIITGPNTFAAILNSLQMGFKTLVIQRRSSEVWRTLGAVKTQFLKYGGVLAKVKRKLDEASSTVEDAETRTRVLQRKLLQVETNTQDTAEPLTETLDFTIDENEILSQAITGE